jgi:hypothetical protein
MKILETSGSFMSFWKVSGSFRELLELLETSGIFPKLPELPETSRNFRKLPETYRNFWVS